MSLVEIVLIAVGLAMDATAVSLAAAAAGYARDRRATFRLSFHFGLFQFAMPILGWWLGRRVIGYIEAYDHWVAFVLLAGIGARMIRSALHPADAHPAGDPSRGLTLITLSVATSIDAMAVGLSLAMLEVNLWLPCVIIGVVTSLMSLVAIGLGTRLGRLFGSRMEAAGGIILIGIGLRILITHLRVG